MTPTRDRLSIGTIVEGRYEIGEPLAAGSFGQIYTARQLSTGQQVALKTLKLHELDTADDVADNLARFERELLLCATLSHPNIVRLVDSGKLAEGELYAVFELVRGSTLREVLDREGPLRTPEAARLMGQVLDAISCAHAAQIVHRDLKPENIMITQTGAWRNAMVLDFGLGGFTAGAFSSRAKRLTNPGDIMGTPCYAAPEQLRGEPPSPRSDLYSWGLILLECLTGKSPVRGRTAHEAIMAQLGTEPIAIPTELRHRRIGRILEAVTVKDVERRDVTVLELLESLGSIREQAAGVGDGGAASAEGERRLLTLVSCRAQMMRRHKPALDPEDSDAALRALRRLCDSIASRWEAAELRAIGNRVVLAFGYPRAHEGDARRAVRAALRIAEHAREISGADLDGSADARLQIHVGVDSGLVIVRSEPMGASGPGYEVVGVSAQIASLLDERAAGGEVLVSAATRDLLKDQVDVEPAGTVVSPPSQARIEAYCVVAARSAGRSASPIAGGEGVMLGRDNELAHLLELWRRVEGGQCRAVLLSGDAGIGKSRLARELRRRVPEDAWVECRCAEEDRGSPLRPIVDVLSGRAEPVDALLRRYGMDSDDVLPLFASLLGMPPARPVAELRLSPDRRKELTLDALIALLLRMASSRPLVLHVEDLHWADPTTIELLGRLVAESHSSEIDEGQQGARMLLLFSARPEFTLPWPAGDVTIRPLTKLESASAEQLVRASYHCATPISDDIVASIVRRADGVPLFIEELSHVLAGQNLDVATPGASLRASMRTAIPATLRELLAARIDTLSPSTRDTVQYAAALGREFRYDLLQAITGKSDWILSRDVSELAESRICHPRRRGSAAAYVFRHALIRDAAHDSMVRSVRRRVHGQIADLLLRESAADCEQRPELPALHLEEAGNAAEAAVYWYRAGDRALRRAAYAEAGEHLERALNVLATLPVSTARLVQEVEILTTLGTVQFSTKGYGAPEVEETFARARVMCETLGETVSPKILSGIVGVSITRGDRQATEGLLRQFEGLIELRDDPVASVTGYTTLGLYAFWRGELERATDLLECACQAYRTEEFRAFTREYGYDGGLFSYGYAVWNFTCRGLIARAEATYREFERIAEQSPDPYSIPLALSFGAALAYGSRDADRAGRMARELIEIASEQRMYLLLAVGQCASGGARLLAGDADGAIEEIRSGLEMGRMIGAETFSAYYSMYLAAAELAAGRIDEGLALVEAELAQCATAVGRVHEPELLRIRGELLLAAGNADEADRSLTAAFESAAAEGAGLWQLRCAVALARSSRDASARADTNALLRRVYDSLDADPDLPDMRDAAELLG